MVRYNEFLERVDQGQLSTVTIKNNVITWTSGDSNKYKTIVPINNEALPHLLSQDRRLIDIGTNGRVGICGGAAMECIQDVGSWLSCR